MADQKDWRLQGQESYLKGVTLVHRRYRRYTENQDWDHDHCAFCWAKFLVGKSEEAQHQGYATEDDYYWVCETCFNDFKGIFEWKIVNELP